MKNIIYLFGLLLFLILNPVSAFAENENNFSGLYSVKKFNKVDFDGNFKVKISQNKNSKVELIGKKEIISNVIVNVINDTLFIRLTSDTRLPEDKPLNVEIYNPQILKVVIAGLTDASINNIDNNEFTIKLADKSKAMLSGKTQKLFVYASGKSKLNTDNFKVINKGMIDTELSGSVEFNLNNINTDYLKVNMKNMSVLTASGTTKNFNLITNGSALLNSFKLKSDNTFLNMDDCSEANIYAESNLTAYLNGASTLKYSGKALVKKKVSKNSKFTHID